MLHRSRLFAVLLAFLLALPIPVSAQTHPTFPATGHVDVASNLRAAPGTASPKVGMLQPGATVTVTGCNTPCDWYQLDTGQWVSASLVQGLLPAQAAPAAATACAPASAPASPAKAPPGPAQALPAAGAPAPFTVVGWNVGLDDADAATIAQRIAAFDGVDLWGIAELNAIPAATVLEQAAEAGEGADFGQVLGRSGNNMRLLALYDTTRFDLLGSEELKNINVSGTVRAPLVLHLRDKATGQELLFMVNHLYRSDDAGRLQQAQLLNAWAKTQTLPVIAVGDYNFDWVVPGGATDHDAGYDALTANHVWQWVQPTALVTTQCSGWPCRYNSVLDFVFTAGPAQQWPAGSRIAVAPADFPDDAATSDHRPVLATFAPAGVDPAAAAPPAPPPAQPGPAAPSPAATALPSPAPAAPGQAAGLRIVGVDKRAEFVVLRNEGGAPVDLRGWTLVSEKGNQAWTVAREFVVQPGAEVTIHAGNGVDDGANLYSGFGDNIWNNSQADAAVLKDPEGVVVSRFE